MITSVSAENVKRVIENFQPNQILGQKEIKNDLGYGDPKVGKTIEAMWLLKIITLITGKGKVFFKRSGIIDWVRKLCYRGKRG